MKIDNWRAVTCVMLFLFTFEITTISCMEKARQAMIRDEIKAMFYHAYENYLRHAFPMDELKPLSCQGVNSMGRYSLTLVDALDTLVVMGNYSEFEKRVWWIIENLNFNTDVEVSVFETNIRILGGLLAAHLLITHTSLPLITTRPYRGELLNLAYDLGSRLLVAFNTSTKIPYGTINLQKGVMPNETTITATACAGTFGLEFGVLSKLTGDQRFIDTAKNAVRAVWKRRSSLGLVGNHIDIQTGYWSHRDAGIGSGVDSFFEYLLKCAIYFNDDELLEIFEEAYSVIQKYLKKDHWYFEVDMFRGTIVWPLFNSLQAYWPGLEVLFGEVHKAALTMHKFHSIVQKFGLVPEGYNIVTGKVQKGQAGYPLRPEMAESLYFLSRATRDSRWYEYGLDLVYSIQNITKVKCGYAAVADIETHKLRDHMASYFLAETCKYLYLLFDNENFVNSGDYIFNTEGHLFPLNFTFHLQSNASKYLQLIKEEALEISLKDEEKEANEIIVIIEENDENDERKMKNEYKTEESMGVKSVPLQIPISKKEEMRLDIS